MFASKKMNIYEYVPWDLLPWFFSYQVSAVLMFGAIFVAIGSACNDLKEAQSLMTPVWLLVCAPMFVWIYVIKEPMSAFATGLSLFPPCTPMLMLMRQATPVGVPAVAALGGPGRRGGVHRVQRVGGGSYLPRRHPHAGQAAEAE